ncbi:MAG: hypothetical protein NZL85_02425 [Fimbriimonadales bacterium]|nr:hypothetical protein [Fimbriimonadales bacterium]
MRRHQKARRCFAIKKERKRKRRARDKVACAFGHYLGHRSHCRAGKNAGQRYYRIRQERYEQRLKRLEQELIHERRRWDPETYRSVVEALRRMS